jgi:tRNA1Val (adenine37-N6)-methyltransferase
MLLLLNHMDYKQSDFYRFNSDSIFLVKSVVNSGVQPKSILDLCAGCGVIGLELCQKLNSIISADFVDVIDDNTHLTLENIQIFKINKVTTNVYTNSVGEFSSLRKYDLIVCNPPYFSKGKGRESSNYNRQISRTFMIDTPEILILKAIDLLHDDGQFYILIPNNEKNWLDLIDKYGFILEKRLERASIYLFSKSYANK